ncbi:helix-turn-helix domain-containing protein [Nostocoides jenkinsii]|uniref:Resolvase HTH domain-containing protein n=1 Tax=Nostocoides jenkinsii Ben 74 TaxID=1193518 RepID=A0A077M4R6_9MICO|nr:hypothetical protein BN13_1540002 [Tetrasphaera jenkinsii Ben 74]
MEDWALIRRLAADGVAKAEIARKLGISRTTVVKAVASSGPPKYERAASATSFTPFESRVRALLAETLGMPATVIAERVGWSGSIRWFRDNVNRVRADHQPIDPADRLSWSAGDVAQCDLWFPPRKILLEDGTRTLLPVLVIMCAHSRFEVPPGPWRHRQFGSRCRRSGRSTTGSSVRELSGSSKRPTSRSRRLPVTSA